MHKMVKLLVVLGLSFFLFGCADSNTKGNNNGEEEGNTGGAKKITILQSKVEITEELEALALEYTEETGVEVEIWGRPKDGYFQELQVRLNSNRGPSIFSPGSQLEAERLKSYIYDMSDEPYVADIAPNMELKVDDKVVGVPYGVEGFGLIYNKDLIDEKDISDYASFVETLKKFDGTDVSGLNLADGTYFLIGHLSNYPFSLQEDNLAFIDQLNAGEVTMAETEEFKAFGQLFEDLRAYTPNPAGISYDEQMGNFATGKTAMVHQGNWAYSMFADYDLDFEMGMLPLPFMDNDKLAVGVGSYWSINGTKDEAEIKAASDFLDWMFTSETGQKYIVEDFGFVPAMTNIDAGELDPLSQAVLDASNSGMTIPWSHDAYPASLIDNDFGPTGQEFFLYDDITGEEFIEKMDKGWQNAIK